MDTSLFQTIIGAIVLIGGYIWHISSFKSSVEERLKASDKTIGDFASEVNKTFDRMNEEGTKYGRQTGKRLEENMTIMVSNIATHQADLEHMKETVKKLDDKLDKISDTINKIHSLLGKNT